MALGTTMTRTSFAVPASPDIIELRQPDMSAFKAKLRGDEWNNWVETKNGYSIRKHSDGYWKYIDKYKNNKPVLSNTKAGKIPPAGIRKHIQPNKKGKAVREKNMSENNFSSSSQESAGVAVLNPVNAAAAYGTFNGKILFILAEFTDQSGSYLESSFASFITDNISDYFYKASYGKVTLSSADESFGTVNNGVIGWLNMGYAHPDTAGSTGDANRQLTKDAILAADPYIDYSSYDTNSDGYVDSDELAVVVIAAGYETSYDGGAYSPTVWGHKWSLGWDAVSSANVDGVIVGDYHFNMGGYAQFGEMHQSTSSDNHQATMGIMVHELGHLIFGLPDLYDTDGSSNGSGAFCVMASGSWGKASSDTYAGETPVLPGAWIKYNRGWVNAPVSFGSTTMTAAGSTSATDANTVYRLPTQFPNEYFMVENRQPEGYDRGLERWLGAGFGGLAIWQIDEAKTDNTEECIPPADCTTTHYKVALKQADNLWDLEQDSNRGNATDLWYLGNSSTFDLSSTPDSDLYNGNPSSVSVANISSSGTTMTADLTAPSINTIFMEDFEGGSLGAYWSTNSSADGRIQISSNYRPHRGDYHLSMDDSVSGGSSSLNELILTIDLSGQTGVMLGFFHKEFGDEDHVMPSSFNSSRNADGVAVSANGTTWYKVQGLTTVDGIHYDYRAFTVDLDAAVASAGISYNSSFKIKFQQYDNYSIDTDGFSFDDIQLTANALSTPVPGSVTPSNIFYNDYVDSSFDLATDFTDNESSITSCEYCRTTDGTCDTEWLSATLSGLGPEWTCSKTGLSGNDGDVITLNMRATSGDGTGEGSAITVTVDASLPTDGTLMATPGDSRIDLSWSGFSDSGSGLDSTDAYKLVYSTTASPALNCSDSTEITDVTTETIYAHTGLTNGLTYYYHICAIDAVNNVSAGTAVSSAPEITQYELTTIVSPAGSGSISPDHSGGYMYDSGTMVILTAYEDSGYPFDGWTGCDLSANQICTMTMDADKSVTAAFDVSCMMPARNTRTFEYYLTLQDAYDEAQNGDTIQSQAAFFGDDVNIDRNISVTFAGGYNCDYSAVTGQTAYGGTMTVSDGIITIGDFEF